MAKKALRPIRVEGQVAYVTLTRGFTAVIDAADAHLVDGVNWYAWVSTRPDGSVRAVYAVRAEQTEKGQRLVHMHRVITPTPEGLEVDHRDGDGLNNRRSNLRAATRSENARNRSLQANNTSGIKGVSWDQEVKKWRVRIWVDGKNLSLGHFKCQTAAALAYAKASRKLFGEFGRVA